MTARIHRQRLQVLATGIALPGAAISTAELLSRIENNFKVKTTKGRLLARRLGIETRHISRPLQIRLESPLPGFRNPDLAASALKAALKAATLPASTLQFLLGHTATPARLLPPNIAEVAVQSGYGGPYAELRQACTGFASALQMAGAMLMAENAPPVAIVGSEVGSVYFDPLSLNGSTDQWVNMLQMGDGAGAIVLAADDVARQNTASIECAFYGQISAGHQPGFALNEGGSDHPGLLNGRSGLDFTHDYQSVKENGEALFEAGLDTIRAAGYKLDDFRYIVPHQVNGFIGAWMAKKLGLPAERFFVNAHLVGNLGSAAIWVALHQLRVSGRMLPGEKALILGAEATHYMYGGFVYTHA